MTFAHKVNLRNQPLITSNAVMILTSACPYVSWQWTATTSTGKTFSTSSKTARIVPGVPTPIVSPSDIS